MAELLVEFKETGKDTIGIFDSQQKMLRHLMMCKERYFLSKEDLDRLKSLYRDRKLIELETDKINLISTY